MKNEPKSVLRYDTDDELRGALRGLADVAPPSSLLPTVMRCVREPRATGGWAWWTRPRTWQLRLSPFGALVGATALALLVVAVPRLSSRPGAPRVASNVTAPAGATAEPELLVRFVLSAKGAKQVGLAGDFNGWDPGVTTLEPVDGAGTFVATVPLRRGSYEYMFVVDGHWMTDPAAAERRPDGFGRVNGVLRL